MLYINRDLLESKWDMQYCGSNVEKMYKLFDDNAIVDMDRGDFFTRDSVEYARVEVGISLRVLNNNLIVGMYGNPLFSQCVETTNEKQSCSDLVYLNSAQLVVDRIFKGCDKETTGRLMMNSKFCEMGLFYHEGYPPLIYNHIVIPRTSQQEASCLIGDKFIEPISGLKAWGELDNMSKCIVESFKEVSEV